MIDLHRPLMWSIPTIQTGTHVLSEDGWCWCQPVIEDVLPFDQITVHRHFMDRPEYDEEAGA